MRPSKTVREEMPPFAGDLNRLHTIQHLLQHPQTNYFSSQACSSSVIPPR